MRERAAPRPVLCAEEPAGRFDEGGSLLGRRVHVMGYGEGVVRAFRSNAFGSSSHEVDFALHGTGMFGHSGAAALVAVRLRRKANRETPWLVLREAEAEAEAPHSAPEAPPPDEAARLARRE